jgi:hypothetical protein
MYNASTQLPVLDTACTLHFVEFQLCLTIKCTKYFIQCISYNCNMFRHLSIIIGSCSYAEVTRQLNACRRQTLRDYSITTRTVNYSQLKHLLSCYCITVLACSVLAVYEVSLGTDICVRCYVPSYDVSSWKLSPRAGPDRCGKIAPSPDLDPQTVQPVASRCAV